jgi:hypothetical protein
MAAPHPDPVGNYRIKRALWRGIADALIVAVFALVFGGVAIAAALGYFPPGAPFPANVMFAVVFGFFGLLCAAGTVSALQGIFNRTVLEVGAGGIWTQDMGHLDWDDVADVRRESWDAPAGRSGYGRARLKTHYRLGILPRDGAQVHDRKSASLVRRMAAGYYGFVRRIGGPNTGFPDLAPYGIDTTQLGLNLDDLMFVVAKFHRVDQQPAWTVPQGG